MTVARIISEHPSGEAFNASLEEHREAVTNGILSNADFSASVQTGATSNLILTTYTEQAAAKSNLVERQEWFSTRENLISVTFYYKGDVKTLLKGGKDVLLADITAQNELKNKVADLIAEPEDLKTEVHAFKEMLSQLLAQLPS